MASPRKIKVRTWLALVGCPVVVVLAILGDRESVEQAIGALMICDGLIRLYGLATDQHDERPVGLHLRSVALSGVSTVLLGAGFMSSRHALGIVFLALAAIATLAGWLFQKTLSPYTRTSR